jgi:hypothetical protein
MPVAWGLTLVAVLSASPWTGTAVLTVLLGGSISLLVAPAALTAWRSHDVSAVASSAWLLLLLEALLTGVYGELAGIDANVLYAAVAVTGSLAILLRIALPTRVHARLVRHPTERTSFQLAS